MLSAVLIGITWTTLSFLFCLVWGRALMALSDTNCARKRTFRAARPRYYESTADVEPAISARPTPICGTAFSLTAIGGAPAVGGGTLDDDARAPTAALSMPNVVIVSARLCVGRIPRRRGRR
jgi:hypothetical protein